MFNRVIYLDTPNEAQRRLQTIMEGTEYAERVPPIFARLNMLMTYLQAFGVKRKVYINPLGSLHDKFYRGSILFQCIFDRKRRDVFAAGGRYDQLIQEFSPKVRSSRPQAHAVGFNLSLDWLFSSMIEYMESKLPTKGSDSGAELYWTTRRVSPLAHVHSYSNPLLIDISAMFLLLVSMSLFSARPRLRSWKIFGRMTSALNLQ